MPNLIVLRGPVGAGKTTTMQALSKELSNHTVLEIDGLKRMINPTERSLWRRRVAFNTGLFVTRELLSIGRSVITETHTRWPEQATTFKDLAAHIPGTNYYSALITAPLEICLERARQRDLPDIGYPIDEALVKMYHVSAEPELGEPLIDTSRYSPEEAARHIAQTILQLGHEE